MWLAIPIGIAIVLSEVAQRRLVTMAGSPHSTVQRRSTTRDALARESVRRVEAALRDLHTNGPPIPLGWQADEPLADIPGAGSNGVQGLFLALPQRRLVIHGGPGSGKTAFATLFAEDLLNLRDTDDVPVPVLLPAHAWDPAAELLDAFVARAVRGDEQTVGTASAIEQLVRQGDVLPVLDGLDELPESRRDLAVTALQGYSGALVLTCGTDELARLTQRHRVVLPRALQVSIRPIGTDALIAYLRRQGPNWAQVTDELRADPHGPLATALSSPGIASLAVETFWQPAADPSPLCGQPDPEAVGSVLYDRWTVALPDDTRRRLSRLGQAMRAARVPELSWTRLIEILPDAGRWSGWPRAVGLPAALLAAGVVARSWWWLLVLAAPLIGLVVFDMAERRPVAQPLRPRLWPAAAGLGVLAVIMASLTDLPVGRLLLLLPSAAGLAVLFGDPWYSGHRDERAAALLSSAAVAGVTTVFWSFTPGSGSWDIAGLAVVSFAVVLLDGTRWGRYLTVRLSLTASQAIPLRWRAFLAEAVRAGVLVRDNEVYRFRHPAVLAFFADQAERPVTSLDTAAEQLLDEVLQMPEAAAYIGLDAAGTRRAEVREFARRALDARSASIAEAGEARHTRFLEARNSLVGATVPRYWSVPGRAYAILAHACIGIALTTLAAINLRPEILLVLMACGVVTGVVLTFGRSPYALAAMAAVVVGASIVPLLLVLAILIVLVRGALPGTESSAGVRPQTRLRAYGAAAASWTALAWLLAAVSDEPADNPWLYGAAVGCGIAAPFLVFLRRRARPYLEAARGLRSTDPERWPSPTPGTRRYHEAAIQAHRDWIAALARDGVLPLIRARLRAGRDEHDAALPALDPSRLGEVSRSDQLVDRAAATQVEWTLRNLTSASIGISGPRGAGKSALLQRFCGEGFRTAEQDVLLLVTAPTAYERREFLVHLFSELCVRLNPDAAGDPALAGRRRRLAGTMITVVVPAVGAALIVATLFGELLSRWFTGIVTEPRIPVLLLGGALIAAPILWSARRGRPARRAGSESALAAAGYLQELRYQSARSEKAAGKISLPGGFEVSTEGSVQRTENLRTYPELVAQFRALLEQAALERRSRGNRIVIGIDELDKMASPADAEQFLNDLKATFNVPGCFFVVAVSEDALAAFDQRALGVRTTFDSAFTRVVVVSPLSVAEAGQLLELRGIVMPQPFLWLCHALSGGRPRELLRTVVDLATLSSLSGQSDFGRLATRLVADDLATILPAQLREAEAAGAASTVIAWIARAGECPAVADPLENLILQAPDDPAVAQCRAYLYHTTTLLRAFGDQAGSTVAGRTGLVDRLAQARSRIAAQPLTAWRIVDNVRRDLPGQTPLSDAPRASPTEGS
ncbi:hypothetical protein L3i22_046540 [Actinoplanes sp. L3-i22]|nr:hypothetical protein L3i22_046540 [Actinoplanes sp. L3-i22]